MEPALARSLWHRLEALNAVTYFSPECRQAPADVGLRGFWMGYFAFRAAPMGPVGPGVVTATFANFHPDRVRRALPDAWSYTKPAVALTARWSSSAAALRRLLTPDDAESLAESVLPALERAIGGADPLGRPLFAANADLTPPPDPVARLWQAATTLREHRGDGHVALLAGAGLDGCEVHVLQASVNGSPVELYQQARGWSTEDWELAVDRLAARGLVTAEGDGTLPGRALLEEIEARTDALAVEPYRALGEEAVSELLERLHPAASRVRASGDISFPNPMGLPGSS